MYYLPRRLHHEAPLSGRTFVIMSGINDALRAAADQFGTPLYVYNAATITRPVQQAENGLCGP